MFGRRPKDGYGTLTCNAVIDKGTPDERICGKVEPKNARNQIRCSEHNHSAKMLKGTAAFSSKPRRGFLDYA